MVTDGGSLQEEATYLGIPCLLMRKATERREGIGENVILSKYDSLIIDDFIYDYKQYQRQRIVVKHSPSNIIIESACGYS